MDPGLVYEAVANDEIDVTAAFSTDGRIYAFDLLVLEDDLGFFPPYFAAPVVREEILGEDPRIAEVMNQLAGRIDDRTMADLNLRVDEEGAEPRDVARAFLDQLPQRGAAGTPAATPAS